MNCVATSLVQKLRGANQVHLLILVYIYIYSSNTHSRIQGQEIFLVMFVFKFTWSSFLFSFPGKFWNLFGKTHIVLHQIPPPSKLGIRKRFTFILDSHCGYTTRCNRINSYASCSTSQNKRFQDMKCPYKALLISKFQTVSNFCLSAIPSKNNFKFE